MGTNVRWAKSDLLAVFVQCRAALDAGAQFCAQCGRAQLSGSDGAGKGAPHGGGSTAAEVGRTPNAFVGLPGGGPGGATHLAGTGAADESWLGRLRAQSASLAAILQVAARGPPPRGTPADPSPRPAGLARAAAQECESAREPFVDPLFPKGRAVAGVDGARYLPPPSLRRPP